MLTRGLARALLIAALLATLSGTFSRPGAPGFAAALAAPAPGVPAEYADLYATLEGRLKAIDGYVSARWAGQKYDVLFSAELLVANANQGEVLLREQAWQGVLLNLDRYQLLGVGAVKVAIKYPILIPAFPRSAEYLEFYKRLSVELKRRNLKFLAQMTAAFREPAFSSVPVAPYYAGLTHERYRQEKRQMAEIIIREIRPDLLTLENEPQTQAQNTGLQVTVQTFTELIQYMVKLSHQAKVDFISFFWARHFFGYVDYTDAARRLPPTELFRMANAAAARNMLANPPRFTRTGQVFQRLIKTVAE